MQQKKNTVFSNIVIYDLDFSHFYITGNDKNKIQYLSYEILL